MNLSILQLILTKYVTFRLNIMALLLLLLYYN